MKCSTSRVVLKLLIHSVTIASYQHSGPPVWGNLSGYGVCGLPSCIRKKYFAHKFLHFSFEIQSIQTCQSHCAAWDTLTSKPWEICSQPQVKSEAPLSCLSSTNCVQLHFFFRLLFIDHFTKVRADLFAQFLWELKICFSSKVGPLLQFPIRCPL